MRGSDNDEMRNGPGNPALIQLTAMATRESGDSMDFACRQLLNGDQIGALVGAERRRRHRKSIRNTSPAGQDSLP